MTTIDPNDHSSVYINAGACYAYGAEFLLQKKVQKKSLGDAELFLFAARRPTIRAIQTRNTAGISIIAT